MMNYKTNRETKMTNNLRLVMIVKLKINNKNNLIKLKILKKKNLYNNKMI